MSLSRTPFCIARTFARQHSRCFAFSAGRHDAARLLEALAPSNPATDGTQRPMKLSRFAKDMLPDEKTISQNMLEQEHRDNYSRQVFRKWQPGDVYAPKDLSGPEQKKWKNARRTAGSDAFDTLGINPINEYKNFTMMSEYMTEMGRIKHSSQTGLRPVNQRRVAKAIRRAIGLGLMPSVHRHPLVMKKMSAARFV